MAHAIKRYRFQPFSSRDSINRGWDTTLIRLKLHIEWIAMESTGAVLSIWYTMDSEWCVGRRVGRGKEARMMMMIIIIGDGHYRWGRILLNVTITITIILNVNIGGILQLFSHLSLRVTQVGCAPMKFQKIVVIICACFFTMDDCHYPGLPKPSLMWCNDRQHHKVKGRWMWS